MKTEQIPSLVCLLDTGRVGQPVRDMGEDWMVAVSDFGRYEYWRKEWCVVVDW